MLLLSFHSSPSAFSWCVTTGVLFHCGCRLACRPWVQRCFSKTPSALPFVSHVHTHTNGCAFEPLLASAAWPANPCIAIGFASDLGPFAAAIQSSLADHLTPRDLVLLLDWLRLGFQGNACLSFPLSFSLYWSGQSRLNGTCRFDYFFGSYDPCIALLLMEALFHITVRFPFFSTCLFTQTAYRHPHGIDRRGSSAAPSFGAGRAFLSFGCWSAWCATPVDCVVLVLRSELDTGRAAA